MTQIRTYIDQFEKADIQKIEHVFELLENLKCRKKIFKFYCQELRCSLNGGSILGGVIISFSIMEMFVLDNYISKSCDEGSDEYIKKVSELERKKVSIGDILDKSLASGFIDSKDAEALKKMYKDYRIPFCHGLRTKGTYDSSFPEIMWSFLNKKTIGPIPVSWRTMEEVIETEGLDVITNILEILVK